MECQLCGKFLKSELSLVQHTESVHGREGVYQGVQRWEKYRNQRGALTTGVEPTEYVYDIEQSQYCGRRKAWICDICDSTFPKKRMLEQHLISGVHEESRYKCEECLNNFYSLAALTQHLESTQHSAKESRLVHVMINDAQEQRLMITNGAQYTKFFEATLYFDGSAYPNPGAGGAGVYLIDDRNREMYRGGFPVPSYNYCNVTNNQAEYFALCEGLKIAISEGVKRLKVKGDSELVIRQMMGEYRCVNERLLRYYHSAKTLEDEFERIEYEHIPREYNSIADEMAEDHRAWL